MKQMVMVLTMVVCMLAAQQAQANLIAHWSFDDPTDPGHDDSGNGLDLIFYGNPTWGSENGDGYMEFDGQDDYGEAANSSVVLSMTSGFIITTTIKITEYSPPDKAGRIFCKRYDVAGDGYALVVRADGTLGFLLRNNEMLITDAPVPLDNQVDIVAKWDGASQEAELSFEYSFESPSESWVLTYFENKICSLPVTETDLPFRVGSQTEYPDGTNFFKGRIYDMTIVPEPATILLFGMGGLALLRKRRA